MAAGLRFEAAVAPYLGELRAYCVRLAGNRWDAEDLYQDVLLRVFQFYRHAGDLRAVRPLLYKAARNLRIDHFRRNGKRRGSVPLEDAAELCEPSQGGYASARELVEWTAEHLTGREMSMLFLAEVFHYTYNDIAEELQCTVSAVRMVLYRSKRTLRTGSRSGRRAMDNSKGAGQAVDYWTQALLDHEPGRQAVPV